MTKITKTKKVVNKYKLETLIMLTKELDQVLQTQTCSKSIQITKIIKAEKIQI